MMGIMSKMMFGLHKGSTLPREDEPIDSKEDLQNTPPAFSSVSTPSPETETAMVEALDRASLTLQPPTTSLGTIELD